MQTRGGRPPFAEGQEKMAVIYRSSDRRLTSCSSRLSDWFFFLPLSLSLSLYLSLFFPGHRIEKSKNRNSKVANAGAHSYYCRIHLINRDCNFSA